MLVTDKHKRAIQDTWQQMEKLVEEGLVKTIGISNFSVKKIADLLQYAKITPAVNQVELHPYFRNETLHKYCDSKVRVHMFCCLLVSFQYACLQSPNCVETAKHQLSSLKVTACHICIVCSGQNLASIGVLTYNVACGVSACGVGVWVCKLWVFDM